MLARYVIAVALWILWLATFAGRSPLGSEKAVARDLSARWGMIIEAVAVLLAYLSPAPEVPMWRIATGVLFAAFAIVATRSAVVHLAKQFRVDAGLNANHELIRSGPYAVVRHPIYAGMFAMLLAVGLLITRWQALLAAMAIYIVGTEIRVRSEEKLLRGRFGEEFDNWARRVWAYVPFVR